ncbi:MAG: 4-hydroxy-3-methylbut-2-enyl diphosphate reductase, partial [Casimicrobiaceae bacterium]
EVDVLVVVGSPNSSNTNRLREVAENRGVPTYRVDRADELEAAWFEGRKRVGVTAGASAPEVLVRAVVERLEGFGAHTIKEVTGVVEKVVFPLPKGLTGTAATKAPEVGPRSR